MSIKSSILAVAAIMASVNAHIIMKSPAPFSKDTDNSPLTSSNYPCKSNLGFNVASMNNMKVGEKQTLSFTGSAVHNGGSCQLSVTTDKTPTANSKFKVIKSMEGGCPGNVGASNTNTYDFTLPDSIPNGQVTFAWTWFSKSAGQPELYMNCAPVMVTGGASDASKMDALPDMLVANMASISTCKQVENMAIKFPNPGKDLQTGDTASAIVPPTGSCGASGGSAGGGGGASSAAGGGGAATSAAGGGAGGASSAAGGGGATSAAGGGGVPTSAAGGGGATPTSAAGGAAPSNTGGVFAPGASSAAGGGAGAQPTLTTLVTLTASSPAQGTGTPASPSSGGGTGGASGGTGTCSENGAIVCNGDSQFGICNFGKVTWQSVASGTKCSNGTIQKRGYKLRRRGQRPRLVVPGKDFEPGQ